MFDIVGSVGRISLLLGLRPADASGYLENDCLWLLKSLEICVHGEHLTPWQFLAMDGIVADYTFRSFNITYSITLYIHMAVRKKRFASFPSPAGMSLPNNDVRTELFLPRGSLVSDIPAGDGKLVNLFLRCMYTRGVKILNVFLSKISFCNMFTNARL